MIRWTRQHELQRQRILALLQTEARPFRDSSAEAVAGRRALPFFDWARIYLPHYFTVPDAPFHPVGLEAAQEIGIPVNMCWFRGSGKSTAFNTALNLRRVLDRAAHFVIIGSRAEDVAAQHLDFIWLELSENPRIRADYGDAFTKREGDETDFVVADTRLWARGIGQSVRGQRYRQYRPDVFVGDDLEDDIIARNPNSEKQLWDWLFGAVWPAMEGAGHGAHFTCLDTMYGRGCLAMRFEEMAAKRDPTGRPLARHLTFPALDERGQSTWPARYSTAQLARTRAIIGERLFRREYLCRPDTEEASFRPDWIRAHDSATLDRRNLRVVSYLDPSARAAEQNDFKAVVVLGRPDQPDRSDPSNPPDQAIRCLHAWIRHASPGEMIAELFRVSDTFAPGAMYCEDNGFQELIWPLLQIEEKRRGRSIGLRPITNTSNKLDRILSNQGEFERGLCSFDQQEGDQRLLVDQFLDLGRPGVKDDGPDAWDGARRRLPGGAAAADFFYLGASRNSELEALLAA